MEVTREALIAALEDEEPVFSVIEMYGKDGSYASGKLRASDEVADRLLKCIAAQRDAAGRFAPAGADPEMGPMAAIVAAMNELPDKGDTCTGGAPWRVLSYVAARYGFVLATED